MKLEPKAKPVRIRIKSGGEEHFSLDSLKRNFSVQDLWEAVRGKSLSRWLKQQNEKELAEKVDTFSQIEKPSAEDYIKFSSLFFVKETTNQPFEDADALARYYQANNLTKNFLYAFSFLFDSMNYQNGRAWFDSYRDLKSKEEWILFFETRLEFLKDEEEIECYRILSELHESNHDAKKVDYCRSKAENLITCLARKDKNIAEKWLVSKDFFYIDALYKDDEIKETRGDDEWIVVFEKCKGQLLKEDQAKCLFYLALLYNKMKNKDKADEYMKESATLGFKEAKKRFRSIDPQYPELTEIINHYRSGRNVAYNDLGNINKEIKAKEKENYYFRVCYGCIKMFMDTLEPFDENGNYLNFGKKELIQRQNELCSSFSQIKVKNGWRSFSPLIKLISALAWEQKKGSKELFEESMDYNWPDSSCKCNFLC